MPLFEPKGGKVRIQEKEQIKKRMGGKSPDKAEAFVYGNWVRSRTKLPSVPALRAPPTERDDTALAWDQEGQSTAVRVAQGDIVGALGDGF